MKLTDAIKTLMDKGITRLAMTGGTVDIEKVLEKAISVDENALKHCDTEWARYQIDHADKDFIIETNGHYIIATWYESGNGTRFCMSTYGDYDTDEELCADFEAWKIAREAEEIADKMEAERPNEMPRAAWIAIATAELKAAYAAADAAFKRDFGLA